MDKNTLKQTFDLLSLAGSDTTLKRMGSVYIGPCPFCGEGEDRFTLKHTPKGWRWALRQCEHGQKGPQWWDSIQYVMIRGRYSFPAAVKAMDGELPNRPQVRPAPRKIELPSDDWQDEAREFMLTCNDALLSSPHAEAGRQYLSSRKIEIQDWLCHCLGYSEPWKRPAITIPHFDSSWYVTGIKYRYLGGDRKHRFAAFKGSQFNFWGIHNATEKHHTLALIEGELNAISIEICRPAGITVLSFASQDMSGIAKRLLKTIVTRYEQIIIWTDEPEKGHKIETEIGRPCQKIVSPDAQDANDLLQAGTLPDTLRENDFELIPV